MILDEEASLHPQGPHALCGAGASGSFGDRGPKEDSRDTEKLARLSYALGLIFGTPCRNPLTGLSGLQRERQGRPRGRQKGRNPLTGLSGLQQDVKSVVSEAVLKESQSPYGAKWFATQAGAGPKGPEGGGPIPLRG
jgi:hypothetical protein